MVEISGWPGRPVRPGAMTAGIMVGTGADIAGFAEGKAIGMPRAMFTKTVRAS